MPSGLIYTAHLLRLLPVSWICEERGSAQLPSEAHGCLSHYILWDSCMLMCTRGRGQQQSLGLPGRPWTRNPFSVGSQRHELGRLDIQETNKAPSQTGTPNRQQPNTHGCRKKNLILLKWWDWTLCRDFLSFWKSIHVVIGKDDIRHHLSLSLLTEKKKLPNLFMAKIMTN